MLLVLCIAALLIRKVGAVVLLAVVVCCWGGGVLLCCAQRGCSAHRCAEQSWAAVFKHCHLSSPRVHPVCPAALQVMLAVSLDNQDLYSFNHVEGVEL